MDEEYWERARTALADPDRPKRHAPVPQELLDGDVVQLDDVPVKHFEQRPIGAYTPAQPPPADMPVDLVKWAALSRKDRRALIRYHRKQVRGQ